MTVRKDLRSAIDFHRWLDDAPYDGIAGLPPNWMPEALLLEFRAIRNRLLSDQRSLAEFPAWKRLLRIRRDMRWIRRTRKLMEKMIHQPATYLRMPFIPPEVERELQTLLYIQDLASLGKSEGIRAHLGRSEIEVSRELLLSEINRQKAQRPRPSALTKAIEKLVHANPDAVTKDLIEQLPRRLTKGISDPALNTRFSRVRKSIRTSAQKP